MSVINNFLYWQTLNIYCKKMDSLFNIFQQTLLCCSVFFYFRSMRAHVGRMRHAHSGMLHTSLKVYWSDTQFIYFLSCILICHRTKTFRIDCINKWTDYHKYFPFTINVCFWFIFILLDLHQYPKIWYLMHGSNF